MKEIALTQGKFALIDDCDYKRLNRFKWIAFKNGHVFYASRSLPRGERKSRTFYMHWEVIGKPPKGFETSHQDGNGLNNQRNNLQNGTKRQNQQNRIHGRKKSSQYPGVSWAKHRQKWSAQIKINGIKKHLGLYINEKEAFDAYRQTVEGLGETVIKGV
jgi:hypothetical protein